MTSAAVCVPLSELTRDDLSLAGGKAANLGELLRAGFDVPAGFVVTTDAYRSVTGALAQPTQDSVERQPVPAPLVTAIACAYERLGGGPVAVRSSATAEDLPGAAFAGQQDTFLNVQGDEQVLEAVRRCWGSLWTERAVAYRQRLDIDEGTVAIAVVVQQMVPADYAGVMFTADPVSGDRALVVVDASPGLGEAVVAGSVTPEHFVVNARDQVVAHRDAGGKQGILQPVEAGGLPEATAQGLANAAVLEIVRMGRAVQQHFGRPQDIEWAITDGRLRVLQARPMTALPPPPLKLNRIQRMVGATLLELFPRRPYPMEVSAWILPTIGAHVTEMLEGITGVDIGFAGAIPLQDAIVAQFVPPMPHPTPSTPLRLWRSIRKAGAHPPDRWRKDPRYANYRAQVTGLSQVDLTALPWSDLRDIPARATLAVDEMTELRVLYLPAVASALLRLRVLLGLLGRTALLGQLVLDAPTQTKRANAQLEALAAQLAARPELSSVLEGLHPETVATAGAEQQFRADLRAFLTEFGHRETSSLLLLRDPTWAETPATVRALIEVLADSSQQAPVGRVSVAALTELLSARLIRLTGSARWVRRLVARAGGGVALREDTHFELTRLMPVVRGAVQEMGRRLNEAGQLEDPDLVWMLTLDDLDDLDALDDLDDLDDLPDLPDLQPEPTVAAGRDLTAIAHRRQSAYAELASSPLIATTSLYPATTVPADALVTGVGAGGGRGEGPVQIVHGPHEFGLFKQGDVLVCSATNPSWTPLFPRAAGIVVDHGGLASHAAIVAREYGVPTVMGAATATTVLVDGQVVRVDGDRGVVTAATR